MKIKNFNHHLLLWVIPLLIIMTPLPTWAGHDQQILDREISLELHDVPLSLALSRIEVIAGIKFVYSPSQIDLQQKVSIAATNEKLGVILNDLLGPMRISFRVDRGKEFILLRPVKAGKATTSPQPTSEPPSHQDAQAITGTVTDALTKLPIAGANVLVKGTTSGTTTDVNGTYAITAGYKDILVFSFIGYKKMELQVGTQTSIDVLLEQDVTSLNEVIINAGYYSVTDKTKTGNISKITSREIEKQPVTSPLMALQGRMPGVDISPVNGVPGSALKVEIRGKNSLRFDGSYPLYIVDGVPINSSPIISAGSSSGNVDPLSGINPGNIESIEVLKDGVATALYGSRGANGVVLITTKKGSDNGRTNFDLSLARGIGQLANQIEVLDTKQYLLMRHEALANDGAQPGLFDFDLNNWDTTRYTNWQEELLGGAAGITDLQAGISGGNSNTSFRVAGSFHDENTIYPGDFGYQAITGSLNLNHTSANDRFTISTTINYGAAENKLFSDGSFVSNAVILPPVAPPIYDENGQLNWEIASILGGVVKLNSWINPLSVLKKTHSIKSGNLVANGVLNYAILPALTLKANLGYTELTGSELIKDPIDASSPTTTNAMGTSRFGTNRRNTWIVEPQVTYRKNFGDHGLDVVLGTTLQQSNYLYQSIFARGYTTDVLLNTILGSATQTYTADDETQYKYAAAFARVGYSMKKKYLVDLIGRRDGSSRFGPGKQFGNFGAVGAAWIFSSEPFMDGVLNIVSFGKLRGSYGITGNDKIGDYQFYNTYSISPYKFQGKVSLYPTALYNPDFRWENTRKLEIGVELGFLKEHISMEVSRYRHRSSNQLVNHQLPSTTGFGSITANFDALIENSGWEGTVTSQNIMGRDFKWSTSVTVSVPRNKLVRFDGIEDSPYATTYKVGEPLSVQRLFKWTGVDPVTGTHTFLDINGDGLIDSDEDMIFADPLSRQYYGGINNSFSYRAFQLSIFFQFSKQQGYKLLTATPGIRAINQSIEVLDRWTEEGDVTDTQAFSASNGSPYGRANRFIGSSTYAMQPASFLRLKTLSLSYHLSESLLRQLQIEDLQVYLQGQNLATFTHFVGLDPETGSLSLPPLRMIVAGIQFKL